MFNLGSIKRLALALVFIMISAAGTLLLYDLFVQSPINLPDFADNIVRITIIATFWLTVLFLITRSKKAISKHLGDQPATVISFILAIISILVMTFAVLNVLGVSPNNLLAGAGIVSITFGLIVSTFVGSLLSGIFVFSAHRFKVGDKVIVNNIPGQIEEITAMIIRVRTDLGLIAIPNNAVASGTVLITKLAVNELPSFSRLPYAQGDRIVTTYMQGEGIVTEITPLFTKILLDSGKELTFLNSSILSGSIAVAKRIEKS